MNQHQKPNYYHRYLYLIFLVLQPLLPTLCLANDNDQYSSGLISFIDIKKGELLMLHKRYTFKPTVKVIIGKKLFPTVRDLTSGIKVLIRYTIIKNTNKITRIEVIPI